MNNKLGLVTIVHEMRIRHNQKYENVLNGIVHFNELFLSILTHSSPHSVLILEMGVAQIVDIHFFDYSPQIPWQTRL